MATKDVRNCSIYRIGVVLKTKRNLISVECGMGYCTPQTTSPYQTPSPFHFMTSLQSSGTDSDSLNSDGIQTA